MVVVRGWGDRGMGSYCLMGIEFYLGMMTEVLETDGSDGCTKL